MIWAPRVDHAARRRGGVADCGEQVMDFCRD
jgi:hypothetical protein